MRLLLLLSLLFFALQAQTYEEYLREQEAAFSSFKEERDREFSEYLSKEWKAYQEAQGVKGYEEPKPKTLPQAKEHISKAPEKKILIAPVKLEEKRSVPLIKIAPLAPVAGLKTLHARFFGVELALHYDKALQDASHKEVSKEMIAQAWNKLASSEYETTIKELREISQQLNLNDWAAYLLVTQVSEGIYSDKNQAKLFGWFALLKLGYDARIAYQPHRVLLLLRVKKELYNTAYYELEGKRYYAIDFYAKGKLGPLKTYDASYEDAQKSIDFGLERLPHFAQEKVTKRLVFRANNKNQPIELSYNKHLLDFFQTYPQVAYSDYFSSAESLQLQSSLKVAFEPLLRSKSQSEALNLILAFVQHAFAYRVDREQFGREKVMFPSETIFYAYSDCEDRAILFAYMVKILLGMEVLGLKYSEHMATAVRIDEKVTGEYVSYNQRAYIVADPTYRNAGIGLSMPRYAGTKSYEIILTKAQK